MSFPVVCFRLLPSAKQSLEQGNVFTPVCSQGGLSPGGSASEGSATSRVCLGDLPLGDLHPGGYVGGGLHPGESAFGG